jgi:glycosyltransferase involved in cell wall biosynthesis
MREPGLTSGCDPALLLVVADGPILPSRDGSATVYYRTLQALATRYPVSCIIVTDVDQDLRLTEALLRQLTQSYLIIQERRASKLWVLLRALLRSMNRTVFAPYVVEQWGRKNVQKMIRDFIVSSGARIVVVHKLLALFFLGFGVARSTGVRCVVDLHGDVVTRVHDDQTVTKVLCAGSAALRAQPFWRRRCGRARISFFSMQRARQQEAQLLREFDRILACSFEEFDSYRAWEPHPERFRHIPWPLADEEAGCGERTPMFDAGFVGFDTAFNLEGVLYFLREVLPLVRRRRSDFRFLIAGRVAAAVRATWRSDADFESRDSFTETREFYDAIKVAIVPLLHGTGVSIKTLEALSCGCPVVTTPVGARGLGLCDGEQAMVAATAEIFADRLVALADAGDMRARLAANGRAWVLQHHGPQAYLRAFAHAIGDLQEAAPARLAKRA